MSIIFDLNPDLSNLPKIVKQFDMMMEDSKTNLTIQGKTLEQANREQPSWYCYYNQQLQDIKSLERVIENKITQKRGELWRKYREVHTISLSSTDIGHYIDSDPEFYNFHTYLTIVVELVGNMSAIVKAFEQRGYTLRNLTEMYVHEVQNALIG